MSRLRVAMFVGTFPVISETFVLQQITGLLKAGHDLAIYADVRGDLQGPLQPVLKEYNLLDRTTFTDMPPASAPWELPIRPILGRSWIPGQEKPVWNLRRTCQALPALMRVGFRAPRLLLSLLRQAEHGYCAASLSSVYRAAVLVRHKASDILHAHFGLAGNHFRFARQLWRAPLIVTFYGYDFTAVPQSHGPGVYDRLFATADRVIGISGYACEKLAKLGCPLNKLRQLPLGLYLDEFPFRERRLQANEPVRVLTIGRLVEKKGIEYSIRAITRVRQRFPTVRYDIVGDGSLRPQIACLIAELGQQDHVILHGARDQAYVQDLLAKAHLFVLASVTASNGDQEGQGVALVEAQASGLPVIATQHGPFPEVVDENGSALLVPERDSEALAQALEGLVSQPHLWAQMGGCGRRVVSERFDQTKLDRELVRLYEETLHEYRGGKSGAKLTRTHA